MEILNGMKYVLRFWRDTIMFFGIAVSAGLAYARFVAGRDITTVLCIGRVLVSAAMIVLLSQSNKRRELDYYANLGVGPRAMLWGVAAADYAVFLVMLAVAARM